jgi:RNA polymerase sigma-70 factor, ECF subfamily
MQTMNDSDIIKQVIDGDIDQFEQLIEKYKNKVFSIIARRIPTQDHGIVAQEVFLKSFRSLNKFTPGRPFENWLITITIRNCCDYWRVHNRVQQLNVLSPKTPAESWFNMVEAADALAKFKTEIKKQEQIELIETVLHQLTPEDRLMVELIYFEDWPLQQVADTMQWKLSKVKVRSMRARNKMRQHISVLLNGKNDER